MYSLKDDHFPQDWVKSLNCHKFMNRMLNWAYWSYYIGPFWHKSWNFISLDLADEKWEKVEYPFYSEEDHVFSTTTF